MQTRKHLNSIFSFPVATQPEIAKLLTTSVMIWVGANSQQINLRESGSRNSPERLDIDNVTSTY